MTAPRAMGTTNGIDLSPDGRTLYVGESGTGQIWSYAIHGTALANPRLLKTFEADTIDGLRTDVAGRLLIARILKGSIAIMTPDGKVEREIALQGKEPTNLAFGGADGKTIFEPSARAVMSNRFAPTGRDASTACRLPTAPCREQSVWRRYRQPCRSGA